VQSLTRSWTNTLTTNGDSKSTSSKGRPFSCSCGVRDPFQHCLGCRWHSITVHGTDSSRNEVIQPLDAREWAARVHAAVRRVGQHSHRNEAMTVAADGTAIKKNVLIMSAAYRLVYGVDRDALIDLQLAE